MRFITMAALCVCLMVGLTACGKPDRKTADARLATACEAAVKVLYDSKDTLTIREKLFSDESSQDGLGLRTVKLFAHYVQDGGSIEAREYTCSFEERSGLFGYLPKFYRMSKDGLKYGNFNGTIEGDFGDLIKIQEATEKVLIGK